MKKFYDTISEISRIFAKNSIEFVLTRFDKDSEFDPEDLDILVPRDSFDKTIQILVENGYTGSSHDQALGGRIKGMQMNLTKAERIKIDLHQDFTWKVSRYFDLDLIWKNLKVESAQGLRYPASSKATDVFVVIINIIFEKTYLKKEDYYYIKKNFKEVSKDPLFITQATNYGWPKTFSWFIKWFDSVDASGKWPVFLPTGLVINSYVEKFLHEKRVNITSLLYYLFFRVRFALNGVLPYD